MVNRPIADQSNSIRHSSKARFEQARMTDVTFLLETMFIKEEATVQQILDCLYDIGSVNLIDQHLQQHSLNRIAKWIARHSKPVFRKVALHWFKRNCPDLITDWLYMQVRFEPQKVAQVVEAVETQPNGALEVAKLIEAAESTESIAENPETAALSLASERVELEHYRQQVRLLHSRVKILTTLLVGITVTFGAGLIWAIERHPQATQANSVLQTLPTQPKICEPSRFNPCH